MSEVTITFMSPRVADFTLKSPLLVSILDLKTRVSQEHPSQPPVRSQRILFSGRLLRDNEILNDVFNPAVHNLALTQKFQLVIAQPQQNPPPNHENPNTNPNMGNFNPNFHQQNWAYFQGGYGPYAGPQFQAYPGVPPYPGQGQYQGHYPGPYPPQFPGYQGFPQGAQFPANQFQGQFVPPGQFQMPFPGQFPPAPAAAGPGAFIRGRVINIEFSMIVKLAILVYVLGQGSTEKLVALGCVAVAYYLYNGFVRGQQNQQNQQNQPNNARNNNPAPQEDNNNPHPAQNNPVDQDIPSFYFDQSIRGHVLRFIVPFFMSFLPSWRPPQIPQQQPQRQDQPQPN